MEQTKPLGLPLIRERLDKYNLSANAKDVLMASWRKGTTKQYKVYLDRWQQFCHEREIDVFQPDIGQGVEFLVSLFTSGLGYSAVNTARSALFSTIMLKGGGKFGCMKGIFELKPALPKYTEIWNVNVVLQFLKTFDPDKSLLSLKEFEVSTCYFGINFPTLLISL